MVSEKWHCIYIEGLVLAVWSRQGVLVQPLQALCIAWHGAPEKQILKLKICGQDEYQTRSDLMELLCRAVTESWNIFIFTPVHNAQYSLTGHAV